MGLDQYLDRNIYVGAQFEHREVTGSIDISIHGEKLLVPFNQVCSITLQVGYWRKANAIHKWFVDNVQEGVDDCGRYYVSKDDLRNLLGLVNQVLADHSKAEELLPSTSGFFFGGTDYDEWYFDSLENTKTILEEALKEEVLKTPGDYYYHSSW